MGRRPRLNKKNTEEIKGFFDSIRIFMARQATLAKQHHLSGKTTPLVLEDLNHVCPIKKMDYLLRFANLRKNDLTESLREEIYNLALWLTANHDFQKRPLERMTSRIMSIAINENRSKIENVTSLLNKNIKSILSTQKELDDITGEEIGQMGHRSSLRSALRDLKDKQQNLLGRKKKIENALYNVLVIPSMAELDKNDAIHGFNFDVLILLQNNLEFAVGCQLYYDSLCSYIQKYYGEVFHYDDELFERIPLSREWYMRRDNDAYFMLKRAYRIMVEEGWIEKGKEDAFVAIFAGTFAQEAEQRPVVWTKRNMSNNADINMLIGIICYMIDATLLEQAGFIVRKNDKARLAMKKLRRNAPDLSKKRESVYKVATGNYLSPRVRELICYNFAAALYNADGEIVGVERFGRDMTIFQCNRKTFDTLRSFVDKIRESNLTKKVRNESNEAQ